MTRWFSGPCRGAALGLALAALCLVLSPGAARAARVTHMTLEIQREGEPAQTHQLVLSSQGDMAQYVLKSSQPPNSRAGSFLLTRDQGKSWYAIDPAQGECARWTDQDMAAVISGYVHKLKRWAGLKIEAPEFRKLSEEPGEAMLGLPTWRYTYRVSFGFKAKLLFSSWEYRITRDIEVWACQQVQPSLLRDWLVDAPLLAGHGAIDRLIKQGLAEVKGAILKKRVRQAVTDKKGKTTRSQITQTVNLLGEENAPPVFAPAWSPPPCQPQSREQLQKVIESLIKGK
ncbi:MAG: hypothetical protein K9L18_04955 [Desulfarculaceae bacterium]|nr:hypothetical protein [Desulfarculaceae bacterium]